MVFPHNEAVAKAIEKERKSKESKASSSTSRRKKGTATTAPAEPPPQAFGRFILALLLYFPILMKLIPDYMFVLDSNRSGTGSNDPIPLHEESAATVEAPPPMIVVVP
jgi:hypothetical protein